jgi:uracil-DNA glycosylase
VNKFSHPGVEAWLRYADDLRLGPYYRDRASRADGRTSILAADPSAIVAAQSLAAAPKQESTLGGRSETRPEPGRGSSDNKPAKISGDSAPEASSSAPKLPVIQIGGTSLFEERVENDSLERIRADIGPNCTRCKLHKARTNIVFGVGNPKAQLVFVGEGPGRDEDAQGEPFVGRAGKLLTQMIEAMGLRREDVYICNVVKCRPPENRLPESDEIATCSPYLLRQLGVIQPKVICCLGSCSSQTMLKTTQGISKFRGEWFDFHGSQLIATYHPAYLLRNPAAKSEVWKDLQKVMTVLGLALPKKK